MKRKLPVPCAKGSDDERPLSPDDLQMLDAFCADIPLDECGLDDWVDTHANLDLCIPLWISPSEAASGCNKTVKFSRSIKEKGPMRQPATVEVTIAPGAQAGETYEFPNLGDCCQGRVGKLTVSLRIRKS